MQSNKASKKTRKITDETVTAAPEINAAGEATGNPRNSRSSKSKKIETAEMGLANHQHKAGSPAVSETSTAENTPLAKTMAAAASADVTPVLPRQITHEEIAKLAHSYWAARGYAHGSAEADWLRAERELVATR
jgi:hypothetical protein